MTAEARIDVELAVKGLDQASAVEVWQRMGLVAKGFLLDEHEVEVTTYRYTEDDGGDVEIIPEPAPDGAEQ